MSMIANTPSPPYYAVIFTSLKAGNDPEYDLMAAKMAILASQQDGYLGVESARTEIGITVSYWKTKEAILKWKNNADHLLAQQYGKEKWYAAFTTRICLVEREYGFHKE